MDVAELLARAVEMVHEAGETATDAREYLDHDEWEVALDILADRPDGWQPPAQWWDLLIEAADLMWLAETATWCRWRRWESVHGIIRAELRLARPATRPADHHARGHTPCGNRHHHRGIPTGIVTR